MFDIKHLVEKEKAKYRKSTAQVTSEETNTGEVTDPHLLAFRNHAPEVQAMNIPEHTDTEFGRKQKEMQAFDATVKSQLLESAKKTLLLEATENHVKR